MRDDHLPGVLASEKNRDASEISARAVRLTARQGAELLRAAVEQGTVHGGHRHSDGGSVVEPVRDPDAT